MMKKLENYIIVPPHGKLKIGDEVLVLVNNPDVVYAATAMIPYKNKIGTVVKCIDNGNVHIVIDPFIPAVEFKPSSLALLKKK